MLFFFSSDITFHVFLSYMNINSSWERTMPAWWADKVWCNLLEVDGDMMLLCKTKMHFSAADCYRLLLNLYKTLEEETVILVDFFFTQIL